MSEWRDGTTQKSIHNLLYYKRNSMRELAFDDALKLSILSV